MSMNRCHYCGNKKSSPHLLRDRPTCQNCYDRYEASRQASQEFPRQINENGCPKCGSEMVIGTALISGTVSQWLEAGVNYLNCMFDPDNPDEEKQVIIEHHQEARSLYCKKCRLAVIQQTIETKQSPASIDYYKKAMGK